VLVRAEQQGAGGLAGGGGNGRVQVAEAELTGPVVRLGLAGVHDPVGDPLAQHAARWGQAAVRAA
jgi:hypothetical protein